MKLRFLLLVLLAGMAVPAWAQSGVDVTKLLADTKTFIFDNNKNTVKGYIYAILEEQTTCCGTDRIYLEVKIDPSGYVLKVTALTGKNDCFKQSAMDIVKNIRWDASDFRGPKSVYFEIKPEIECVEGRDNAYVALEIFNNEKLNPDGMQVAGTEPAPTNTPPQTRPATPDPAPTTRPDPVREPEPVVSEPEPQIAVAEPEPTRSQPDPAPTPAPTVQPQPQPTRPSTNPMPSFMPTRPGTTQQAAPDAELEEARRRAEAERIAQEEEIRKLREEMQRLREKEEQQREARLAEERRREQEAQQSQNMVAQANDGGDSDELLGGLFLEEQGSQPAAFEGDANDMAANEEDRLRQDIQGLEQRLRDLEEQQRQREEEERRRQDEAQAAREEMLRLTEEIAMKEEEAEMKREQRELDQIEQDRMRAEEERRNQEEEYQRLMDEIKRLQDEADAKIATLEDQKQEMDRISTLKKMREQEIVLERALREQERQRMLEEKRLTLWGSQGASVNVASSESELQALMASIPDFTAEVDSEKLLILIQTISQLQAEIQRLQLRMQQYEQGGSAPLPQTGGTTRPGTPTSPTNRPATSGNLANGGQDTSWEKLDIYAPGTKPSDYVVDQPRPAPRPTTSGQSGTQTGPSQVGNHQGTHWDGPGPKFAERTYVDGDSKMKDLIKQQLRSGGVCGLGQAAFSVTLDPQGNVIRHAVLAANKPMVELQLNSILPGLKFNPVDYRYNQTVYLEFKAEIICDGAADKVRLQEVPSIIRD